MSYEYNVPYVDFITSFGENDGADKFFDVNTKLEELSIKERSTSKEKDGIEKSDRPILQEVCSNIQNIGSAQSHSRDMKILSASNHSMKSVKKSGVKLVHENLKTQVSRGSSKPASVLRHKKHFQIVEEVNGEFYIKNDEIRHAGVPRTIPNQRTKTLQQRSFEERQKLQVRKKEDHIKKILEEEKKKRVFHANPIPNYLKSTRQMSTSGKTSAGKYTLEVKKSTSVDTGKKATSVTEKTVAKSTSSKPVAPQASNSSQNSTTSKFRARPAFVVRRQPFVPRRPERSLVKPGNVTLHSEKRAKARREFDEKLRQHYKELEDEARAKKEQEVKREKEEIAELRKKLVHKAQPVPLYKSALHGNGSGSRPKNSKDLDRLKK
ncbi:hypothetical protein R5R35_009963 [Gryllus longicercus]|uniref:TPX2 C-terminal domain-containing protein n=1 Tax=Gryllus longicercus TaxID=2509291 RepID=A0AAN9VJ75_9ORTH